MSQSLTRRLFTPAFRAQFQQRLPGTLPRLQQRAASSGKPKDKKPIVLEKPDKFRPPSHPQRLSKKAPIREYGPVLTASERAAQRVKKYPNMMPPEGSFMHWFLTNRMIHFWICMTVLGLCGFASIALNFKNNSPYYDMLPSMGQYFFHPISSIRQFFHVYHMHVEYTTAKTAEKRKIEMEEASKRRAYRIAHGLETHSSPGMVPTTLPSTSTDTTASGEVLASDKSAVENVQQEPEVRGPARYKKFFGIW